MSLVWTVRPLLCPWRAVCRAMRVFFQVWCAFSGCRSWQVYLYTRGHAGQGRGLEPLGLAGLPFLSLAGWVAEGEDSEVRGHSLGWGCGGQYSLDGLGGGWGELDA